MSVASHLPDLVIDLIFQHLEAIVREEEEWNAWRGNRTSSNSSSSVSPSPSLSLSPPALAQRAVYKELSAMASVSQSWNAAATRRLYRSIAFISPRQFTAQLEHLQARETEQAAILLETGDSGFDDLLALLKKTQVILSKAPAAADDDTVAAHQLLSTILARCQEIPALVCIDLSAADCSEDPVEVLGPLITQRGIDRGKLRTLHFPTYDRFIRMAPPGLENNQPAFIGRRFNSGAVNHFFEGCAATYIRWADFSSEERQAFEDRYIPVDSRVQKSVDSFLSQLSPSSYFHHRQFTPPAVERATLPMPLSNLRVLTLPVSWEWSHHLYHLVTDETCDWIARWCPELREIRAMSGDVISPDGLKALVNGCRKLTMLRIWKAPQQTDQVLEQIGRCLPDLHEFALSFAPKVTPEGLAHLFALPKLAGVDLTCCRGVIFTRELFQVLERTGGKERLERLDLSVDFWGLEEIERGGTVPGPLSDSNVFLLEREMTDIWTALKTFDLETPETEKGEPPSQEEMTRIVYVDMPLSSFANPTTVANAYLASLRIAHFFTFLSTLPNLTVLILSGHSALSYSRLQMLFPLGGGPLSRHITKLGLGSCTSLTDTGITYLARHGPKKMEQLELLRMSVRVTDVSLRAIADAWGDSLEVLEISESFGFTTDGLDHLASKLTRKRCKVGHVRLPVSAAFREKFGTYRPTVFGWIDWGLVEFPILSGDGDDDDGEEEQEGQLGQADQEADPEENVEDGFDGEVEDGPADGGEEWDGPAVAEEVWEGSEGEEGPEGEDDLGEGLGFGHEEPFDDDPDLDEIGG